MENRKRKFESLKASRISGQCTPQSEATTQGVQLLLVLLQLPGNFSDSPRPR